MKQFLKNIGGIFLFITIFLGVILLGIFMLKGSLWFSEKIFPWGTIIFLITIAADTIILLPLSIARKTREIGLLGLFASSYLFGLLLWAWSFLIVYSVWGWIAIIIGFLIAGVGIVPIAVIALILNSYWTTLLQLGILIAITFGIRIIVSYAAEKSEECYET